MNPTELRAKQAPFKNKYRDDPASALVTLRAIGRLDIDSVTCHLDLHPNPSCAGLHPLTGGDGSGACSAEMLLHALVGCAGVTLGAVATAMEIAIRAGSITAEGDVDFRGTLGISRDVPIGFQEIRLKFDLDSDAPAEKLAKLIELTERYCVVYQTLKTSPRLVQVD
ncbi:MAG: OsmC family protein [Schlesneria sp.]|nr:OsmC family protein [Schlesneria sp.]